MNKIVPFTEMWMCLETVIENEVSQKEKNKQCIISFISGVSKNSTDELICKAEIEKQMQKTNAWMSRGEEGGGDLGDLGLTYIHYV